MNLQGPSRPTRYHPRVETDLSVQVLLPGRTVTCRARDVSMAGLFLLAHPGQAQRQLTVALTLPGGHRVVVPCDIRRREMNGVALEFTRLDWDDFLALARYLHPRLP